MFRPLKERAKKPELMDNFALGGHELREALRHLRRLNHIFYAAGPALHGVKKLWKNVGKPKQLRLLDIGCGSGEVNRKLLRWADRNGIEMNIQLVDLTIEACEEARLLFWDEPRITVKRGNLFDLEPACADFVIAGQFVHHFSDEELPRVAASMLRASRYGVAIQDIHRHWIPWAAVWITTRLISKNRYIRHDGPLSVAKGFRASDWRTLQVKLEESCQLSFAWIPLFRYSLVMVKGRFHE